jgi:DNA-cytosine methyltransferase
MNVLSLFDGMSCGRIALERLGIKVDNYYASEIDKYAMKVSEANYPDIIQVGDITELDLSTIPKIDLIMGGSPCQGFSFAGKQLAFDDPRSALFFEFVRCVKELKPKYFLLENVRMKKEYLDVISEYMGVEPIMINSALVSAQNRVRYYWTNIPGIEQPEQRSIVLRDILEDGFDSERDKSYCIDANYYKGASVEQYKKKCRRQLVNKAIKIDKEKKQLTIKEATKKGYTTIEDGDCFDMTFPNSKTRRGRNMKDKSNCLTAANYDYMRYEHSEEDKEVYWRKLTPVECERLQTVPDNYTNHVSNTQRYKMLGNGWTIEVITHILKNIEL